MIVELDEAGKKGVGRKQPGPWLIVIPLALASLGFWLRRDFSVPPLYGSWLASAANQLAGVDQTSYVGVPYMTAWAWIAIVGLLATLWVRSVDSPSVPSSWRPLRVASNLVLPAIVGTALPWFAWPLSLLIPIIALSVPLLTVAALAYGSLALRRGSRPSRIGLMSCLRALSWTLLVLELLDWANLVLIGGS